MTRIIIEYNNPWLPTLLLVFLVVPVQRLIFIMVLSVLGNDSLSFLCIHLHHVFIPTRATCFWKMRPLTYKIQLEDNLPSYSTLLTCSLWNKWMPAITYMTKCQQHTLQYFVRHKPSILIYKSPTDFLTSFYILPLDLACLMVVVQDIDVFTAAFLLRIREGDPPIL